MLGRKRWLLKIYILGRNQKKLKNFTPWSFFGQHRAHPGRSQSQNITDIGKNFQHPYQQKIRIRKEWWKKYLPLPFPVQPNLYYLQHSPNTHPWLGKCNTRKVKIHSRLLCNPPKGRFRVTCWGAIRRKYVGWVPEKNWVYICSYMWGNGESPKNAMLVVLWTWLQMYFWYYHKNTKDKVFPFWFQSCIQFGWHLWWVSRNVLPRKSSWIDTN